MRYAIISDIHGNLPALSAVLEDTKKNGADEYILLGDYCTRSQYPNEVVDTLRRLPHLHIIRGNEEDYFATLASQDPASWTDGQFAALYWAYHQLKAENSDWLQALPEELHLDLNGAAAHMAHDPKVFIGDAAAPFHCIVLPERYKNRSFSRSILLEKLTEHLSEQGALYDLSRGIYLFGHTHVQWHTRVGESLFINPGSCGHPLDLEGGAPYILLDIDGDRWEITPRRVSFDLEKHLRELRASDLYQAAPVWTEIILREMATQTDIIIPFFQHAEAYADRIGDPARPFSVETWEGAFESWKNEIS